MFATHIKQHGTVRDFLIGKLLDAKQIEDEILRGIGVEKMNAGTLRKDAQEGGAVADSTRRDIEKRSGKPGW